MPPYKPYASLKQQAWAHTAEGKAQLGTQDVQGKDAASKGMKLPTYSSKSKMKDCMGRAGCKLLFLFAILTLALPLYATTVTGTFKQNGTPFSGYVTVSLNYPGSTGTYINFNGPSGPVTITNGTFASFTLDGNDIMLPAKTYYTFDFYDLYGNEVTKLNYYISGSTFDLGAAVPTPVLTNNINFLDLLGLRSLSVQNLTILNALTFGNMVINQNGVNGAQNINNVLYADAYHTANPSSTSCGIQEAMDALPISGGIIYLQQGLCSPTATVNINKPVHIIGFGQGGWSDNSLFTTSTSSTTFTPSFAGPMFSIGFTGAGTLSGVTLEGFGVLGPSIVNVITIGQGNTSSFVNQVVVKDVFTRAILGCGVNIVGNASGVLLDHVVFGKGGNGACITSLGGYTVSGVRIQNSQLTKNTFDGLQIDSAAAQDIKVINTNLNGNGRYGANISSASASVQYGSQGSTYNSNVQQGLFMQNGVGASDRDQFQGNSNYGAYVDVPASSNVNLTLKDTLWQGNGSADIFTGANTHTVVSYPTKVDPATSQTVPGTVKYVTPSSGTNVYFTATTCNPPTSTDSNCTGTITVSPAQPDASYMPFFSLYVPSGAFYQINQTGALTTTSIPYTLTCTFNCATTGTATVYVHLHHN